MTQGSQFPATQFYNPYPETLSASQTQTDSLSQGEPSSAQPSSSAPVRGRNMRNAKVNGQKSLATSPIIEEREQEQEQDQEQEDQDMSFTSQTLPGDTQPSPSQSRAANSQVDANGDVEMNGNDAESRASDSSDDENDNDNDKEVEDDLASIPDIQPPKPRNLPPSSQTSTTPIYPSLSSLPKEFLRKSWANMFGNGNNGNNASGPTTPVASRQGKSVQSTSGNGNGDESDDDSGSSSDSSVERAQAPPSILKGRFASGGMERKKAASQPAGW